MSLIHIADFRCHNWTNHRFLEFYWRTLNATHTGMISECFGLQPFFLALHYLWCRQGYCTCSVVSASIHRAINFLFIVFLFCKLVLSVWLKVCTPHTHRFAWSDVKGNQGQAHFFFFYSYFKLENILKDFCRYHLPCKIMMCHTDRLYPLEVIVR